MAETAGAVAESTGSVLITKGLTDRVAKKNGNSERLDRGLRETQALRSTKARGETRRSREVLHLVTKHSTRDRQETKPLRTVPDSTAVTVNATKISNSGLGENGESLKTVTGKSLTLDGGSGKKGLVNTRCPSRGARRLANVSSGNSTVDTQKSKTLTERPGLLDIGDDSRVKLLGITSKLFHSGTEVDSTQFDSLCLLKDVEFAQRHFGDLVKWFTEFETTKARNVIGFDLAMELCACYNIIIQRVARDFSSAFDSNRFLRSISDTPRAEYTLRRVAELSGEQTGHLRRATGSLSCVQATVRDDLRKLIVDTADNLTLVDIEEVLERRFANTTKFIETLIETITYFAAVNNNITMERDRLQSDLVEVKRRRDDDRERLERESEDLRKRNEHLVYQIESVTESKFNSDDKHVKSISDHVERYENAQMSYARKTQELLASHENTRRKLEETIEKLHVQLTVRDDTITNLQTAKATRERECGLQIATLAESNAALTNDLEQLRDNSEQYKLMCSAECDRLGKENEKLNRKLSEICARNDELMCALERHKIETENAVATNAIIEQELALCENERSQSMTIKSTLASIGEYLTVDVTRGISEVIRNIQEKQAVSVGKIETLLNRHCVRISGEIESEAFYHHEVPSDGQLFKDYETRLLNIIKNLNVEQSPMDVAESAGPTPNPRSCKTPTKRKNSHSSIVTPNGQAKRRTDRLARKTCNFTTESLKTESLHLDDCSDIDINENASLRTELVPKYVVDGVDGDVKLINLGSSKPIETLLGVVQKEESFDEVQQNSCHCLQFESLANRLKCAILIRWTTQRNHELYGGEHEGRCLYAIVAHKHEWLRTYYMIVVHRQNASYTYDLSKVPAEWFNRQSQAFVHKEQNCQGPLSMGIVHTEYYHVPVIETAGITLHDNE